MRVSLRDKSVLITGANGFIGAHLARRLLKEGAKTHILLRNDSNQFRIKDIIENLTVWYGDIIDYHLISSCIKSLRPQIIFHLAAFRDVNRDIKLINPMIDINIKGTMNLMKAILEEKVSVEYFINTGSSEEYGDGEAPFQEDQREVPVSPYSASKVATTYFCRMLHKSMGLPIVTLRPFLTYGPAQNTDMFIPSLIKHCLEKRDFQMTEGDQTRDFNYIDDVVEAYLFSACSPAAIGKVINIGGGVEYRIKDVAQKVVNMTGNPIKLLIGALTKRPGEAEHFFCANEKAKRLLGWSPKISLNEGLKKTIDWYWKFFSESLVR